MQSVECPLFQVLKGDTWRERPGNQLNEQCKMQLMNIRPGTSKLGVGNYSCHAQTGIAAGFSMTLKMASGMYLRSG